ncbi:hypothetical protein KBF38_05345, partial [bacterium]|nr:hypothetical protein [bacterium]
MGERKAILVFGLTCAALSGLPAFSFPTDSEAVDALEKAKILAPTIRLNARVAQDGIEVATYKNPKANHNDCKIEA